LQVPDPQRPVSRGRDSAVPIGRYRYAAKNSTPKITQNNFPKSQVAFLWGIRITRHNPFYDWSKGDPLA
jgi:hypothetical protein